MSTPSTHLPTTEGQDGAKETSKIHHLSRRKMLGLVPDTGHWVAETAPKEMLAALRVFGPVPRERR